MRRPATHFVLGALAVGSCAIAFGACGGDEGDGEAAQGERASQGSTVTQEQDSSITQSQSGDSRGQDGQGGRGQDGQGGSVSQSQSSSSQSSQSSSQSSIGGARLKTFSGTGRQTLSFNVEETSRLVWTDARGERFQASGASGRISIDSRSGRGEIELAPGDYDGVSVHGDSWTIVVRPD